MAAEKPLTVEAAARAYRDLVMNGGTEVDQLEAWAILDDALDAARPSDCALVDAYRTGWRDHEAGIAQREAEVVGHLLARLEPGEGET